MTVVDPPVSPHSKTECHGEGHTGPASHTETLVSAGTEYVGHDASTNSRHLLNALPSDQWSSQRDYQPSLDPFFGPYYHALCENYCCFLKNSDGSYSSAQIQLALPAHGGLPIYVSLPHLGIHGLAYRIRDGCHPRQTSRSAAQDEESPVEQDDGQSTEVGGQIVYAGADDGGGLVMARLLNIIWPVHMIYRYLCRRRV